MTSVVIKVRAKASSEGGKGLESNSKASPGRGQRAVRVSRKRMWPGRGGPKKKRKGDNYRTKKRVVRIDILDLEI